MKRFLAVIFALSFMYTALAQDNTRLHEFYGGRIQYEMTLYSGLMYGVGSVHMGTNSTLEQSGAEDMYWNPAGLAFMPQSEFVVDFAPPMYIRPDKFYDFQDKLNREIDGEFKWRAVSGAPYEYPALSTDFKSGSRIQSMAVAVPYKNFTFGLMYYNPFEVKMDFLETGFRSLLVNEGNQSTAFRLSGDVHSNFSFYSQTFAFSAAYRIQDNLSAGLTIERNDFSARLKADINFYGSLSVEGGEAVLFNDPARGYPNSLFSSADGRFSGDNWGLRLGSVYRPDTKSEIAFTAIIPFTVAMNGNFDISNNVPVFYSGGSIDEDRIDPNATTRTKQVIYNSGGMYIRMPGKFTLGYTYALGGLTLVANVSQHFSELSYEYSNWETDTRDSTTVLRRYRQGIKPGTELRLGIDLGFIKLGGGMMFADEVKMGFKSADPPSSLTVPFFVMAFSQGLSEHLQLDGQILAISAPLSRITLKYRF